MKVPSIRPIVAVVLALLTTAAWAILITVAMHVSVIVLDTLEMIVELAAISP